MAPDVTTSIFLVITNFIFWGHWPICAKLAAAPSQPFGVVMVFAQTLCAWLACASRGNAFFVSLAADSQHPVAVLCVLLGGAALAIGDFSAAAAIEKLGVAVGGPVCFSCMLICGQIGDFALEGSSHPPLLFAGVLMCIFAVVADSRPRFR
jgi:drug/metabolite transporter (DMT)-like permease